MPLIFQSGSNIDTERLNITVGSTAKVEYPPQTPVCFHLTAQTTRHVRAFIASMGYLPREDETSPWAQQGQDLARVA